MHHQEASLILDLQIIRSFIYCYFFMTRQITNWLRHVIVFTENFEERQAVCCRLVDIMEVLSLLIKPHTIVVCVVYIYIRS